MVVKVHADENGQGDGQDDTYGAGHALHHFNGQVRRAHKLLQGGGVGGEVDHHDQRGTHKGQNQGIGHGADHISTDAHAGLEQLPPFQVGIDGNQFLHSGADTHGNVVHCTEGGDEDTAGQEVTDLDGFIQGLLLFH